MRLFCGFILCAPAVLAQNFTGQIRMKSLVPPISQPWTAPKAAPARPQRPVANLGACSIPLLKVPAVDADSRMLITPPAQQGSIRTVTPPAPPCDELPRP